VVTVTRRDSNRESVIMICFPVADSSIQGFELFNMSQRCEGLVKASHGIVTAIFTY